jgi:hypothetical protein
VNPFLAPGSSDDAEQDLVASGPPAFDRWDLLWPIAPKPLLVGVSARDFFGTYSPNYEISGREEFLKLAAAYRTLGAARNLQYFETPLPHGLSYPLRVAVYNWFERHLKASDREITEEPPTAPERDETLWCGATGNTVRDFGGRTPFAILSEKARSITTPGPPYDLRTLLQMEAPPAEPRLTVVARTRYGKCEILAVEVNSAPKVWVPAWIFLPKERGRFRMLLVLEPNGRNGPWHEDELYPRLAEAGIGVCAADLRGVGDLAPQFSSGAAGYARSHSDEENYAWASLILGRSLLGQRVADIVALTRALRQEYFEATIGVAARDKMTVPALCAAAIEPRITSLYLARHLVSWRSLVESENYSCPLANFAPGILRAADLPQIARPLGRRLRVAGAVDGAGRLLSATESPYENYREQPAWELRRVSRVGLPWQGVLACAARAGGPRR